jgi:hypothetical protein
VGSREEEARANVADLSFRRSGLTNQKLKSESTGTGRRNKTENRLPPLPYLFFYFLPVIFPQRPDALRTLLFRKRGIIHACTSKDLPLDSQFDNLSSLQTSVVLRKMVR